MLQQLSLYATVPNSELKITLHTLSALTGMKPQPVFEHNLAWVPTHPFIPKLAAGEINQIEQYRLTVRSDLTDGPNELSTTSISSFETSSQSLKSRSWTINIAEVPEAGKRKVTSQALLSSKLIEGDPFDFLTNIGYSFSKEYWLKGYQFVYGDVVLRLCRIAVLKDQQEQDPDDMVIDVESIDPDHKVLSLIDPSGQWFIKAHANVQNLNDIEGVNTATLELERIKQELAGLFDLSQPDRNIFDTRIKRT